MEYLIQNKLASKFHIIKNETTCLLFNVEDLSLFKINNSAYDLFSKILAGGKTDDLVKKLSRENLDIIRKIVLEDIEEDLGKVPGNNVAKFTLDRLVLNISNVCNLRCLYCYADNGSYGQKKALMNEVTVIKTIDYFYGIYEEINNIQFFGGEPLVNPEMIEVACQYILTKYKNKEIEKLPVFSIVTNGTLISLEIAAILSTYDVNVTISIDGPEYIHDYLRGKGTFNKIKRNIEILKDKGIKFGVECTFTNYHLSQGISVSDVMEFFEKEFGLHVIHIPCVAVPEENTLHIEKGHLIDTYKEAIRDSLTSLNKTNYKLESNTYRLLRALIYKKRIEMYCPAGVTTISVSCEGDIYPCFMFTGNQEFLLGNVCGNRIRYEKLCEISESLKKINNRNDSKCCNCWARFLCYGCVGNDYISSGSLKNRTSCEFNKEIIEFFLLNVYDILNDPIAISRVVDISEVGPIMDD